MEDILHSWEMCLNFSPSSWSKKGKNPNIFPKTSFQGLSAISVLIAHLKTFTSIPSKCIDFSLQNEAVLVRNNSTIHKAIRWGMGSGGHSAFLGNVFGFFPFFLEQEGEKSKHISQD